MATLIQYKKWKFQLLQLLLFSHYRTDLKSTISNIKLTVYLRKDDVCYLGPQWNVCLVYSSNSQPSDQLEGFKVYITKYKQKCLVGLVVQQSKISKKPLQFLLSSFFFFLQSFNHPNTQLLFTKLNLRIVAVYHQNH